MISQLTSPISSIHEKYHKILHRQLLFNKVGYSAVCSMIHNLVQCPPFQVRDICASVFDIIGREF